MIKTYNKLVRDNIPTIIKNADKTSETRILNDEEYKLALKKKLTEEAEELLESETQEDMVNELADVKELYDTIIQAYGIDENDIKTKQKSKNKKNGAFKDKIFLIHVNE